LSSILTKGSRDYKNKFTVDRDKCGLLEKMLHSFCKEKPCLINPLESSACISKDRGGPADTVQTNFEKAFDKVPHQRLSKKLTCHRMGGKSLTNGKLMNRIQKARFNGWFSRQRLGS